MTVAQELREAMEGQCPFTKDEFIGAVKKSILKNGRYSFTIDARVSKTYNLVSGEVPAKWMELIRKWVYEEGLTITQFHNYYGVPEFDITI